MTITRAKLTLLESTAATLLKRDAERSAEGNELLSKAEQAKAPAHVQKAAAEVRDDGGPGTRVETDALGAMLAAHAKKLIAKVNQKEGVGRDFVSRAEAKAAKKADPALGARVMKAYEITSGHVADVDGLAESYARGFADPTHLFRNFSSELLALNYQDPHGRSVTWLVKTSEEADKATFVWGRNDLWAQRFDVDLKSGALVVTGEH